MKLRRKRLQMASNRCHIHIRDEHWTGLGSEL